MENLKGRIFHELTQEYNSYKIILITPETLLMKDTELVLTQMMSQGTLAYFAIDECHTIVLEKDFRQKLKLMGSLKRLYPKVPIIALTASATPSTQTEIISALRMQNPKIFSESIYRKNIGLEVKEKRLDTINKQIIALIK